MMRLKSNTAKHFEEAFAYYPWLAAHEPAPDEDPTKRTLLHYACYYGRPDVLKLLLDKKYKVRIGAQDEKGYSILHHAAKGGNLECLTLAHAEGAAYLEARDSEGRTPLMVAAFFNQKEVVMRLLGLGANIAAQDFSGATALDIAKKQGHLVLMNAVKALQEKETAMLARDNALKRWLAHPLRSKLYKAWMASPVPHTPVAVESYIFSTTPAHKVEADNIELVRMNRCVCKWFVLLFNYFISLIQSCRCMP
jgi:ankyrin repeat protein